MIEGIKKIREVFRKITAGFRKDATINVHPEYASYIKEKLKEREIKEAEEKSIMFADGEKIGELTQIQNVVIQKVETGEASVVYGIRGQQHPKVIEVQIYDAKGKARKTFRRLYNAGNNKQKMNGQPMKRFIAKEKARKNKCPNRTQ